MKIQFDKIRWQFAAFVLAVILLGIGTGLDAKADSFQCGLVYKLNGEYKTANTLGNLSSVKIERKMR